MKTESRRESIGGIGGKIWRERYLKNFSTKSDWRSAFYASWYTIAELVVLGGILYTLRKVIWP